MPELPTGTVTFLMTDIEGSTARWESEPEAMRTALAVHDAVLRDAVQARGGVVFKHTGDGIAAAFASPNAAIGAAMTAQCALKLPVRMGVCTGEAELRDGDYFGTPLNRTQRIMSAGHGGQVLVAGSSTALAEGYHFLDLGEHRLRGLSQRLRLFQLKAEGLKDSFPPLITLDSAIGNLPTPSTSLRGRERELAEISQSFNEARIVTLTGVGGVGKTRLMLEAASRAAPLYADGAWLCELAAVSEAEAVEHVVAAQLGVKQLPGKGAAESMIDALSGRHLLLVLDNCEHLIEPVAALIRRILPRCPKLAVFATSREALAVEGERTFAVAPLATAAGADSPAVQLFSERARAVAAGFELTRDPEAVVEICRRLDGIPLAIELAAARVRAMSPRQILDRLDERFRLLGGSRRALGRHQTLAQAVQWSYDLLNEQEKQVLARASVFAGGFTLEAAEAVCSGDGVGKEEVLDLVDSLLRKSLLTAEEAGDAMRYGMLETIRQFAAEHGSGELEAAQAHHAAWFAEESDRRFEQWRSPQEGEAYRWFERNIDNLRIAFRWALDRREVDPAARIASNIGDMARFVLREEAAGWAAEVVDLAREARHPRLIRLLTWAASNAWAFQRLEEAKRYGYEALALLDDPAFEPFLWVYADLAIIALYEGDDAAAVEYLKVGAAHPADAGDRFCMAALPAFLAWTGRLEEARVAADHALALAEVAGMPSPMVFAYRGKGLALAKSDPHQAIATLERGLAVAERSGAPFFVNSIAIDIANLQAKSGEPKAALESFRRLLAEGAGMRDSFLASAGFSALILLFERLGQAAVAATLYGALPKSIEKGALFDELAAAMERVREGLGDAPFKEHLGRGATMTLSEASRFARDEVAKALASNSFPAVGK
jgi:predicted ATPase